MGGMGGQGDGGVGDPQPNTDGIERRPDRTVKCSPVRQSVNLKSPIHLTSLCM